jgi:hypothetical protein
MVGETLHAPRQITLNLNQRSHKGYPGRTLADVTGPPCVGQHTRPFRNESNPVPIVFRLYQHPGWPPEPENIVWQI